MLSGMLSVGTVSSQPHHGLGPVVMHLLPDSYHINVIAGTSQPTRKWVNYINLKLDNLSHHAQNVILLTLWKKLAVQPACTVPLEISREESSICETTLEFTREDTQFHCWEKLVCFCQLECGTFASSSSLEVDINYSQLLESIIPSWSNLARSTPSVYQPCC